MLRWRGVRQSAIRLEQPGHPPLDGAVADTVPELPGIRHAGVLAEREVEPDKRRVLREPSMPKPKPVEANASAAPGVTSSNACCQAAKTWGVTSVAPLSKVSERLILIGRLRRIVHWSLVH